MAIRNRLSQRVNRASCSVSCSVSLSISFFVSFSVSLASSPAMNDPEKAGKPEIQDKLPGSTEKACKHDYQALLNLSLPLCHPQNILLASPPSSFMRLSCNASAVKAQREHMDTKTRREIATRHQGSRLKAAFSMFQQHAEITQASILDLKLLPIPRSGVPASPSLCRLCKLLLPAAKTSKVLKEYKYNCPCFITHDSELRIHLQLLWRCFFKWNATCLPFSFCVTVRLSKMSHVQTGPDGKHDDIHLLTSV